MDTFYRNHHHCHHHHHSSSPFERYGFMGTEAHRFLILLPSTSSFSFPCCRRYDGRRKTFFKVWNKRNGGSDRTKQPRECFARLLSTRTFAIWSWQTTSESVRGGRNARAPTSCAMYARTSTLFAPLVPLIRNRRRGAEPLSHSS